jgi:hypothetical protein
MGKTIPGREREFADRDPARGAKVRIGNIENRLAGLGQGSVDLLAGCCLGRGHGRFGSSSPGSELRLQVNPLIVTRAFRYRK